MLIVRYFNPDTQSIAEGRVDAPDEARARSMLEGEGKHLLSARPASGTLFRSAGRTPAVGATRAEVAVFCSELRSLVGAGLSVVEALQALDEARDEGAAAVGGPVPIYARLLERLRAGRSLSAAMQDVGGFPALLVASVQSSERTSHLPQALDAYLRFDRMVSALAQRVTSAALYPGIVMGLGLMIALFLLWVVMPRFAVLYGQMGQQAGVATRLLLGASRWLHAAPWVVPLLAGAAIAVVAALLKTGGWRALGLASVEAVPLLRRHQRQFELARFYEALALLVEGGYGMQEALGLCQQATLSTSMRDGIAAARCAIERGRSVSGGFAEASLTDAVTVRLLRAGEQGGDFAAVLHAISARHAAAFEVFVERATRLVEPILLLLVAMLVGSMVVTLYMPIFDIASTVR